MTRLTDNAGYDAEPIISADGRKIVFGSQRDGDFDAVNLCHAKQRRAGLQRSPVIMTRRFTPASSSSASASAAP